VADLLAHTLNMIPHGGRPDDLIVMGASVVVLLLTVCMTANWLPVNGFTVGMIGLVGAGGAIAKIVKIGSRRR
jgi:hypothetical protein